MCDACGYGTRRMTCHVSHRKSLSAAAKTSMLIVVADLLSNRQERVHVCHAPPTCLQLYSEFSATPPQPLW